MMDPRQFYLQWAAGGGGPMASNPYLAGGMRPPGPLPGPYLHSLAQFHNLKALATKNFLEQQNLAKSILQQASSQSSQQPNTSQCKLIQGTEYTHGPRKHISFTLTIMKLRAYMYFNSKIKTT